MSFREKKCLLDVLPTAGDTASEEQIANTYEGLFRLGKNPDYWDKKRVKLDEISYSVQKPRQPTTTSTKAAKKYFAKALKELGVKKLSFNLLGDDDDVYKKETEFIQSALSQTFGSKLSVSVTNLPKETRLSRQSAGNFQVFLGGLTSDFPDPHHFLSYLTTDQPYNFGKWSNASYDQAIKASSTMHKDKRQAALRKAERIIADQQPITTLFHLGQAWMIRANVKGVVFNGEYPDFKHAYAVKN